MKILPLIKTTLLIAMSLFLGGCAVAVLSVDDVAPSNSQETFAEAPTLKNKITPQMANFDEVWIIAKDGEESAIETMPKMVWNGNSPSTVQLLPLVKTTVKAKIYTVLADVNVTHTFQNKNNLNGDITYTLPLTPTTTVTDFSMTIGNRRIRGLVRKRKNAEELYSAAKSAGYNASLLTKNSSNEFVASIANIRPERQLQVSINYYDFVKQKGDHLEFTLPFTNEVMTQSERQMSRPEIAIEFITDKAIKSITSKNYQLKIDRKVKNRITITSPTLHEKRFNISYKLAEKTNPAVLLCDVKGNDLIYALIAYPSIINKQNRSHLKDIAIKWNAIEQKDSTAHSVAKMSPTTPIIITGILKNSAEKLKSVYIKGMANQEDVTIPLIPIINKTARTTPASHIWAQQQITQILTASHSPQKLNEAVMLSEEYAILSKLTSFIVVDTVR